MKINRFKLSLIACPLLWSFNCFASDTIINVPTEQLLGNHSVRVELTNSDNGKSVSTMQSCSNTGYCSIIFKNYTPQVGLNGIKLYSAKNHSLIGEVVVDKFGNHMGNDIYNISMAQITPVDSASGASTSVAPPKSAVGDPKDISIRINGFFKMVGVFFPGFKPFSDFASGFLDLGIGKGPSAGANAQMQAIIDALNYVNQQILVVQNQITDFNTQYNKDKVREYATKLTEKFVIMEQPAQNLQSNLNEFSRRDPRTGKYTYSFEDYLNKYQINATPLQNILSHLGTEREQADEQVKSISRDHGMILNDFVKQLELLKLEQSRADRRVNYIALYNYYNSLYTKYLMDTLASVRNVQELDRLAAWLISSDNNKFGSIYRGNISVNVPGVSPTKTYEQNLLVIKSYYDTIFNTIVDSFPVSKLEDTYGKIGLKLDGNYVWEGKIEQEKLLRFASSDFTSFDGFTLSGIYGGKEALTSWESAPFVVSHSEFNNSIFWRYSSKHTKPYSNTPLGNYLGATEIYYIPSKFTKAGYDGGPHLFQDEDNGSVVDHFPRDGFAPLYREIEKRNSDMYHKSPNVQNAHIGSTYQVLEFNRIKFIGDATKYDDTRVLDVVDHTIKFPRPAYKSLGNSLATGIYSIKIKSPKDNREKLYTFGINYSSWTDNYSDPKETKFTISVKYRNKMGWGATVFCPALNCQQEKPGTIVFPDNVSISLQKHHGKLELKVEPSKASKYTITTKFPNEYTYSFYNARVGGIATGEHLLIPNGTATFTNTEAVHSFRYIYNIRNNTDGKTDQPEFPLEMKDDFCKSSYSTSVGVTLTTCVHKKGDNVFEIVTKR